jgi:hypothetical protein
LLDDFVFRAAISTRFSTELLKTFTQILYFSDRSTLKWFQKCLAAFSANHSGADREFSFPKRNFPAAHVAPRQRASWCGLAIIVRRLQNVPDPNEISDSQRR